MPDLRTVLVEELHDLLSAETQIVVALPKMVKAAQATNLKDAFETHLEQTKNHVERIKQALQALGETANSKVCKGMKGILDEGKEAIKRTKQFDEFAADITLIAAAHKVEHYEIGAYSTAKTIAARLDEIKVGTLLSETLDEEKAADTMLTTISRPLLKQATVEEVAEPSELLTDEIAAPKTFAAAAGQSPKSSALQAHSSGATQPSGTNGPPASSRSDSTKPAPPAKPSNSALKNLDG